jgi:hypothetical protein
MFAALALFALAGICQANYYQPQHHSVHAVSVPVYGTSYIPKIVHAGTSHHNYPVTEHKFSESSYETPGATYAIPATKTYTITRPGYTTYLKSAITKAHVTNHLVKGPTISTPIVKTIHSQKLVPISHGYEHGYGHGGYDSHY